MNEAEHTWAKKAGGYAFAVVFIVAGWWLTALALNTPALPTPLQAIQMLVANADQLLPFFVTSTWRVVVSVALGTILAVPIAQFCARSKTLDALFAPVLYLLYPIPKVVLLPILLVLLGLFYLSLFLYYLIVNSFLICHMLLYMLFY